MIHLKSSIWGPPTWYLLHHITIQIQTPPNIKRLCIWLNELAEYLPCPVCKEHFIKSYTQQSWESRLQLNGNNPITMLWEFHNEVNERLELPTFSMQQFRETYGTPRAPKFDPRYVFLWLLLHLHLQEDQWYDFLTWAGEMLSILPWEAKDRKLFNDTLHAFYTAPHIAYQRWVNYYAPRWLKRLHPDNKDDNGDEWFNWIDQTHWFVKRRQELAEDNTQWELFPTNRISAQSSIMYIS